MRIFLLSDLSLLFPRQRGFFSQRQTRDIHLRAVKSGYDGDVTLTLIITDENGSPIEGARVDVSVDHTDMTGMGMSGPATEQGEGKYAINANFSMSGNWKMTVYVRKDSLDYQEDIDLKIQ
jgi:hypothetical protein